VAFVPALTRRRPRPTAAAPAPAAHFRCCHIQAFLDEEEDSDWHEDSFEWKEKVPRCCRARLAVRCLVLAADN